MLPIRQFYFVVLCCVILLYCVVFYCMVVFCFMLYCVMSCYVMLCYVLLCCVLLYCEVFDCVVLCCVMLCRNELPQLKKGNAIHSYKLLKYEYYKIKLPNWKHIAIWVLPFDGEKVPSKYNTLESIWIYCTRRIFNEMLLLLLLLLWRQQKIRAARFKKIFPTD